MTRIRRGRSPTTAAPLPQPLAQPFAQPQPRLSRPSRARGWSPERRPAAPPRWTGAPHPVRPAAARPRARRSRRDHPEPPSRNRPGSMTSTACRSACGPRAPAGARARRLGTAGRRATGARPGWPGRPLWCAGRREAAAPAPARPPARAAHAAARGRRARRQSAPRLPRSTPTARTRRAVRRRRVRGRSRPRRRGGRRRPARPRSTSRCCGWQLLAALRTLHARGLAHLDLKPDNVVLRDGRPVLVDFGSARAIAAAQPAVPIGTPGTPRPSSRPASRSARDGRLGVGVTLHEASPTLVLRAGPARGRPAAARPCPTRRRCRHAHARADPARPASTPRWRAGRRRAAGRPAWPAWVTPTRPRAPA